LLRRYYAIQKHRKVRLDTLLVERGLVESRNLAVSLIMAGKVYSEGRKLEKAGQQLQLDCPINILEKPHPWVSRGGIKLAYAFNHFEIDVDGKNALDIGSSTGGFTDVLLANGASHVYAVDVGYGQLASKLRNDNRVTVLERTNARYLTSELIHKSIDIITCDVSFINLKTVLPASLQMAVLGTYLLALIKPQFESGREHIRKGGIVKDPLIHEEACNKVCDWLLVQKGWCIKGICESPITGLKGNKEFFLGASYNP